MGYIFQISLLHYIITMSICLLLPALVIAEAQAVAIGHGGQLPLQSVLSLSAPAGDARATTVSSSGSSATVSTASDNRPPDDDTADGGLFAGYKRQRTAGTAITTTSRQVEMYFEMCDDAAQAELTSNCLTFWVIEKNHLPALYELAVRMMSVPASGAPVERVFSHGGIIMRPHRASLGDTTLSQLIFLKCNRLGLRH
jgi:hypothetical protein